MKTNTITLGLLVLLMLGCTNADKKADQTLIQEYPSETTLQPQVVNQDSIDVYNSRLNLLGQEKDGKALLISKMSKQRDSLQAALAQLEASLKNITEKKINPGIQGVNSKLDELKGQKENLQEQIALQRKEAVLASKKVEILNEERTVYQDQKKALYDKGAAPSAFKTVDSLLNGINSKMNIQNDIVKNINRNVVDGEGQMLLITSQREGLSKKIRNNYDTQLILSEFNMDEKNRLETQLNKTNEDLNVLLDESSNLDTDYKLMVSKVSGLNELSSNNEELNSELENQIDTTDDEKSGKMSFALIAIIAIGVLMIVFYLIGKRRKAKNLNS